MGIEGIKPVQSVSPVQKVVFGQKNGTNGGLVKKKTLTLDQKVERANQGDNLSISKDSFDDELYLDSRSMDTSLPSQLEDSFGSNLEINKIQISLRGSLYSQIVDYWESFKAWLFADQK